MSNEYIKINLDLEQKEAILKYTFLMENEVTIEDLESTRSKWVRFEHADLVDVMGELSSLSNESEDEKLVDFLDELIDHLEFYEERHEFVE